MSNNRWNPSRARGRGGGRGGGASSARQVERGNGTRREEVQFKKCPTVYKKSMVNASLCTARSE